MKLVYLISGKLRSGKNQFAVYLEEIYQSLGLQVKQDLFAKDVKDGAREDFSALINYLNDFSEQLKKAFDKFPHSVGLPFYKKIRNLANSLHTGPENFYETKNKLTRILLQTYGTNIFRDRVDPEHWVHLLKERTIQCKEDIVLITDVRFPNEIELMSHPSYELIPVRIERKLESSDNTNQHTSETSLDDFHGFQYIIDNNKDLSTLKESAEILIKDVSLQFTK